MEKSGTITLTQEDLELYEAGEVSDRVKLLWELTFPELRDIIESRNYNLI